MGKVLRRQFNGVYSSQWIEFCDRNGRGLAQPDFYVVRPRNILLFEAKLTQNLYGVLQINNLYRPLLRELYKLPVVGVLVFKNLVEETKLREISTPMELLDELSELTCVWHYIG